MTIRAPLCAIHERPYTPLSFERETLYETLGCCWGLSTKNIDGEFPIKMLIDLSRVDLLYGCPTGHLSDDMVSSFVRAFQARSKNGDELAQIEHNALEMIQGMDCSDFLSFHAGLHDAIEQILRPDPLWTNVCEDSYLALRYYSLNLLNAAEAAPQVKRTFASLLAEFLMTCRRERSDFKRLDESSHH